LGHVGILYFVFSVGRVAKKKLVVGMEDCGKCIFHWAYIVLEKRKSDDSGAEKQRGKQNKTKQKQTRERIIFKENRKGKEKK